jgi:hypothetical protein
LLIAVKVERQVKASLARGKVMTHRVLSDLFHNEFGKRLQGYACFRNKSKLKKEGEKPFLLVYAEWHTFIMQITPSYNSTPRKMPRMQCK